MAKAAKRVSTQRHRTSPADPVMELAEKILFLWDAEDGLHAEYLERKGTDGGMSEAQKYDTSLRLGEWRTATERLVSFAQAKNVSGAVVQVALAMDAINVLSSSFRQAEAFPEADSKLAREIDEIEERIGRLMRSALRGLLPSSDSATAKHLAEIHGISVIDSVVKRPDIWAEKGRAQRGR